MIVNGLWEVVADSELGSVGQHEVLFSVQFHDLSKGTHQYVSRYTGYLSDKTGETLMEKSVTCV
jgi:hypothetical protein